MSAPTFTATPEQLAVLVAFCRREAHRGEYMTLEVQAVVEAVSGPCFRVVEESWGSHPVAIDTNGEALS